MKATHVTISVNIQVGEGSRNWRDPSGNDRFEVTVPIDALDAVNVQKLLPSMLTVAKADFVTNAEKWELEQIKVAEAV
jgi:hypothetical protein